MPRPHRAKGTATSTAKRRQVVGFPDTAEHIGCAQIDRAWRALYRRKFATTPPIISGCVVGQFEVYDDSKRIR